jgi:uncharacterized membrane protein
MNKKGEKELKQEFLNKLTSNNFRQARTLGQKASDALAKGAGSWTFIIGFFIFLALWMSANILMWVKEWDPYPFILLNLVLSCLAAIQAPIILMSQNRSAQRDRLKAEFDYRINKKAEKEIREIKNLLLRREKHKK